MKMLCNVISRGKFIWYRHLKVKHRAKFRRQSNTFPKMPMKSKYWSPLWNSIDKYTKHTTMNATFRVIHRQLLTPMPWDLRQDSKHRWTPHCYGTSGSALCPRGTQGHQCGGHHWNRWPCFAAQSRQFCKNSLVIFKSKLNRTSSDGKTYRLEACCAACCFFPWTPNVVPLFRDGDII